MQGRIYLNYPPQPFIDFIRESICLFTKRKQGELPDIVICNREEFLGNISKETLKEFESFKFTEKEIVESAKFAENRIIAPEKSSRIVIQTYPTVGTSQQNIPRNHIWLMRENKEK